MRLVSVKKILTQLHLAKLTYVEPYNQHLHNTHLL
jgi:hypothetical protein